MNNILRFLLLVLVYIIGVVLCKKAGADNWSIGLIFGLVVVIWHFLLYPEKRVWMRRFLFVAGSILIYQIVLRLSRIDFPNEGIWEYVYIPVIVGTVLLPILHHLLLGSSYIHLVLAIPFIYLLSLAAGIWDPGGMPGLFINAVSAWQAAYLVSLFGLRIRH